MKSTPPDNTILMNCASCTREMVRECDADKAIVYGLLVFKGRIDDRPYCRYCFGRMTAPVRVPKVEEKS